MNDKHILKGAYELNSGLLNHILQKICPWARQTLILCLGTRLAQLLFSPSTCDGPLFLFLWTYLKTLGSMVTPARLHSSYSSASSTELNTFLLSNWKWYVWLPPRGGVTAILHSEILLKESTFISTIKMAQYLTMTYYMLLVYTQGSIDLAKYLKCLGIRTNYWNAGRAIWPDTWFSLIKISKKGCLFHELHSGYITQMT